MLNIIRLCYIFIFISHILYSVALASNLVPKIVFDKTEIIYSNINKGCKLVAQFPFENQGSDSLFIKSVTTSCDCQVAKFDKMVYPGGRSVIFLDLDTSEITGTFRRTAIVTTNDPNSPLINLIVIGETQSQIKIDKGRRIEIVGCLGNNISSTAIITDSDHNSSLSIVGVENPMNEYLDTNLVPLIGSRDYKFDITSKVENPMEFFGYIYLLLSDFSKISLCVIADIQGSFLVTPDELYFGLVKRKIQGLTRSIVVTKSCSEKLRIDKLIYNSTLLKVEKFWTIPDIQVRLIITPILDNFPNGIFEEGLDIQSGKKIFHVRIKGIVN